MCTRWILVWLCSALGVAQAPPSVPPTETVAVEGRVVDLRGEPVPLAQVMVREDWWSGEGLATGACDGEGWFRIGRVPRREHLYVEAHCDGYCRGVGWVDFVAGEPTPVRVRLQQAVTVHGVLLDRDGERVPGVVVRATLVARILGFFLGVSEACTDARGEFTMADVPLGLVRFAALVPGTGIAQSIRLVQGDAEEALRLGEGPTTSLEVAVKGMPADVVTQLTAVIRPQDRGIIARCPPWSDLHPDAEGRFALSCLPDDDYRISLAAKGWQVEPNSVELKKGRGPHRLRAVATKLDRIDRKYRVEMRDGEGKAVAGVRLRCSVGDQGDEELTDAGGAATFSIRAEPGTNAMVASLDPRWVFDQYRHSYRHFGMPPNLWILDEPGDDRDAVAQVRAIRPCTVSGTVRGVDGRPAPFVYLELREHYTRSTEEWYWRAGTFTDRNGHYAFAGVHPGAGEMRVAVEDEQGARTSEPFSLPEPGAVHEVPEMQLAPPAIVEGTVVDADNKPAPGVRVLLRDHDPAASPSDSGGILEVLTDRQGRYRFLGVVPGPAWLSVTRTAELVRDLAVNPFEVQAGKRCTFELTSSAK